MEKKHDKHSKYVIGAMPWLTSRDENGIICLFLEKKLYGLVLLSGEKGSEEQKGVKNSAFLGCKN